MRKTTTIDPNEIYKVSMYDDVESLDQAIRAGADVNADGCGGECSMLQNVSNVECARLLVKNGLDLNSRGRDNEPSGCLWGCGWGSIEIAKLLLDSGADVNFKYRFGPLLFYARTPEMVQLLIDYGANVNARGYRRMTPLFFSKSVAIAEVLIENGANLDAKDRRRMKADEYRRLGRYADVADFIYAKREQKILQGKLPLAAEEHTKRSRSYI